MREKAVKALSGFPDFIPVAAPAEATTLPDSSVSAVAMGSALHRFDPDAFGKECRRILTPGGLFFSVINARDYRTLSRRRSTPFVSVSVPDFPPCGTGFCRVFRREKGASPEVWRKRRNASDPASCKTRTILQKRAESIQKMTGLYKLVCLTGF